MTSRIYEGGNRALAIANIKSDIQTTCFKQDRGRRVLDMQKLHDYLQSKFRTLAPDEGYQINGVADRAARLANPYNIGNRLEGVIGLAALEKRGDYPTNSMTSAKLAQSIAAQRAKLDALAAAITSGYTWTQTDALRDYVKNYYNEAAIDNDVTPADDRIIESRAWRYAYRTDIGEIGKPSDASGLAEVDQNDAVTVTASAPPAGRFVASVLWYRSASGSNSGAWQFAGEKLTALGLDFQDTKKNEELGEVLPSVEWDEPPAGLRGLRLHPGGFGVGFFDNTLCASVANRLYAWPITWRKTTQRPIVGLAIADTTIFVGTMGDPVLMTGSDPGFLAAQIVKGGQPCRSARSIVSTARGFMYAGAEGITICNGVGETPVVTRGLLTRQQWEALLPESIQAIEHDGCYIFLWNNGTSSGCYSLGIDTGRLATLDLSASALFKNPANGKLYAVSGTQIVEVFGAAGRRTGVWRSPKAPGTGNARWLRVRSDYESGGITVRWYRHMDDGTTNLATYTAANRKPQRVHPAPAAMEEYELEIEGQSALTEVLLTATSEGLK